MRLFALFVIIFSSALSLAGQSNCWNYRDDSGLKVCVNDKVMVIGDNAAQVLDGPFKVIGLENQGVVVLQYFNNKGKPGFTRKAIAEMDIIVLENRQFNSKVKIGDQVVRSSDSRVFEVIGLGAYDTIGIKLGATLDVYLFASDYTKLSK